jgi:hypothetical protein
MSHQARSGVSLPLKVSLVVNGCVLPITVINKQKINKQNLLIGIL